MQEYLLSILIFTPLVAAFILIFIPSAYSQSFRWPTLAVSLLQLIVMVILIQGYNETEKLQFVEQKPWITLDLGSWGLLKSEYFVAVDGLNLPLVCLAAAIMLIAVIASWNVTKNAKGFSAVLSLF
jgi:NADH-quinone oxidoreductase subunit M